MVMATVKEKGKRRLAMKVEAAEIEDGKDVEWGSVSAFMISGTSCCTLLITSFPMLNQAKESLHMLCEMVSIFTMFATRREDGYW